MDAGCPFQAFLPFSTPILGQPDCNPCLLRMHSECLLRFRGIPSGPGIVLGPILGRKDSSFMDFSFRAAGFFRGVCRRICSPHLCVEKVRRKNILQAKSSTIYTTIIPDKVNFVMNDLLGLQLQVSGVFESMFITITASLFF